MQSKNNIYDANYDSDYDDLENNCVAVITHDHKFREVEPVNVQVHFGKIETKHWLIPAAYARLSINT